MPMAWGAGVALRDDVIGGGGGGAGAAAAAGAPGGGGRRKNMSMWSSVRLPLSALFLPCSKQKSLN